jgi:hypothetical protein
VDQKEYGPINEQQLRQWIAEGRANAQTQVRPEGSAQWVALGALPEFLEALAAKAPPPVNVAVAGSVPPVDPAAWAREIIARGVRVDIGGCISRSWDMLLRNFWLVVGATFLVTLAMMAVGSVPHIGGVAGLILNGVFLGGLYYFFIRLIRGTHAGVGDAFAGFSIAFVQLMLASIVMSILGTLGLILCVLPGVYLIVAWVFALFLIIDKKIEFWPAMELSRRVVTSQWWAVFALVLVAALISVAGVLALLVGVFVTLPIGIGAIAYLYEDIFGAWNPRPA